MSIIQSILRKILNWILNVLFKPVFEFMCNILSKVLGFIFENVLSPLLIEVIIPILEMMIEAILKAISGLMYEVMVRLLKLIDMLEHMFEILMGAGTVTLNKREGSIVTLLLTEPAIRNIYLFILIFSLALLLIFSIYAVARSASDFDFEGKKPIPKVLRLVYKGLTTMLLLHIMIIVLVYLAQFVLQAITTAFKSDAGPATIGTNIYLIATFGAANEDARLPGYTYKPEFRKSPSMNDDLRKLFMGSNPKVDYDNQEACIGFKNFFSNEFTGLFRVTEVDYILGIVVAAAIMVIMSMCMIIAVARIFDMILLFIASPFFVAAMPIDDGRLYKAWSSSFTGKLFGAYGGYLAMQIYLVIVPVISSELTFVAGSALIDSIVKILMICGGAWGVYKAFGLLSYFFDIQAVGQEEAMAAIAANFTFGRMSWFGGILKKGAVGFGKGLIANKKERRRLAKEQSREAGQAFRGGVDRGTSGGSYAKAGGRSADNRPKAGDKLYSTVKKDAKGDNLRNFGLFRFTKGKDGKLTSFSVPLLFRWQKENMTDPKDPGKQIGTKSRVSFFGRTSKDNGGILSISTKKNTEGKILGRGFALQGIARVEKDKDGSKSFGFIGNVEKERGMFDFSKDSQGKVSRGRIAGFESRRLSDGGMYNVEKFGGATRTGYTENAKGQVVKAYTTKTGLISAKTKFFADAPLKADIDAGNNGAPQGANVPPGDGGGGDGGNGGDGGDGMSPIKRATFDPMAQQAPNGGDVQADGAEAKIAPKPSESKEPKEKSKAKGSDKPEGETAKAKKEIEPSVQSSGTEVIRRNRRAQEIEELEDTELQYQTGTNPPVDTTGRKATQQNRWVQGLDDLGSGATQPQMGVNPLVQPSGGDTAQQTQAAQLFGNAAVQSQIDVNAGGQLNTQNAVQQPQGVQGNGQMAPARNDATFDAGTRRDGRNGAPEPQRTDLNRSALAADDAPIYQEAGSQQPVTEQNRNDRPGE